MHEILMSDWVDGTYSNHLEKLRDQIDKMNRQGEGYLWITLVIRYTSGGDNYIAKPSHIVAKAVSATPPRRGLFGGQRAEVTVQLTDGRKVPLYDAADMKYTNRFYGQNGKYASPSKEILDELKKYCYSSIDKDDVLQSEVFFYAQNDPEDMAKLEKLMQDEERRREEHEAEMKKWAAEAEKRKEEQKREQEKKEMEMQAAAKHASERLKDMFGDDPK
ncbi:MAG: hypothetical protein J5859_04185 [Clostridia bacterium]|nr:hypothetical protein [Clostridia bacterium]